MNPFEAIRLGLIKGDVPDVFAEFTATDLTQNWMMWLSVGSVYVFDWGDGVVEWFTGTGGPVPFTHTYATAGTYPINVYVHNLSDVVYIYAYGNSLTGSIPAFADTPNALRLYYYDNLLTGSIPSLASNTAIQIVRVDGNNLSGPLPSLTGLVNLTDLFCGNSGLSGVIPSLSTNVALTNFYGYSNAFTGSIPDLFNLVNLFNFYCYNNLLTGDIPDLSGCVVINRFYFYDNPLTGYTPSTISATITLFRADGCALTETAVDDILADFETNVAARPAAGTINLSGGTNAAPSAAGLASRAAILLAKPGWTVTVNP